MASTVVKAVLAINQWINKCRSKKLNKTYFQLSFLHLVQFRTCLPKCSSSDLSGVIFIVRTVVRTVLKSILT